MLNFLSDVLPFCLLGLGLGSSEAATFVDYYLTILAF